MTNQPPLRAEEHEYLPDNFDGACIKCGGFDGEPCEPPTGMSGKELYLKYYPEKANGDKLSPPEPIRQDQLEELLKACTTYDGFTSKKDHDKFLGWLQNRIYQDAGLDIDLSIETHQQDFRSFKIGHRE
jgi:hypothetical protein